MKGAKKLKGVKGNLKFIINYKMWASLILFAAGFALASLLWTVGVMAHPGGISPKDGCHKDNKAGERHWHLPDGAERGGECVDGVQIGNCTAVRDTYWKERNHRLGKWVDEALAARAFIDCIADE